MARASTIKSPKRKSQDPISCLIRDSKRRYVRCVVKTFTNGSSVHSIKKSSYAITHRDLGHTEVLATVGLRSSAVDGGSVASRGTLTTSKVVNHLGIELLDALGLSTAGVAAATTTTTGSSSLGVSRLVSSGGLGLGLLLLAIQELVSGNCVYLDIRRHSRSNALVEGLRGGNHRRVGGIVDNLDLSTIVNNCKKLDR